MAAKEELERVQDRLNRPEGEDLHPRERERLEAMLARSDVLSYAYHVIQEQDWKGGEAQRKKSFEVLDETCKGAHLQFWRYRIECGIPEA